MSDMNAMLCPSRFRMRLRRGLAGFAVICLAVSALCAGCASVSGEKLAKPASQSDDAGVAEKLGIKPVAIRLTAAGTMVDFRYSVLDSRKSLPMFNRKLKTFLVEEASGKQFSLPADTKLGPLRSSSREPLVGREYFIFFRNSGGALKRGSKVAVVVGDMKIENLTIE
jgi:hypothetical protein